MVLRSLPLPQSFYKSMYSEVIAVLNYKHDDVIHAYVSKACVSSKQMYLRHQAHTLYYRHVCILVFLHVLAYSMLLRCMLKFKRLACGSDDVTQYNTIHCCIFKKFLKDILNDFFFLIGYCIHCDLNLFSSL